MTFCIRVFVALIANFGGEVVRIAFKEMWKEYKRQRAALTPEERAEWDRDWTEDFKTDE